jgi:hypothetical protein
VTGRGRQRCEQGAAAKAKALILLVDGFLADQRPAADAADLVMKFADLLTMQDDGDHGDAVWPGRRGDIQPRGAHTPVPGPPPGIEPPRLPPGQPVPVEQTRPERLRLGEQLAADGLGKLALRCRVVFGPGIADHRQPTPGQRPRPPGNAAAGAAGHPCCPARHTGPRPPP